MKYCSHCGKELMDEAVVCIKCGCPVGVAPVVKKAPTSNQTEPSTNSGSYASLIFTFFGFLCLCFVLIVRLSLPNITYEMYRTTSAIIYSMGWGCPSWIALALSLNNAFKKRYDKLIDTLCISISSVSIIVTLILYIDILNISYLW